MMKALKALVKELKKDPKRKHDEIEAFKAYIDKSYKPVPYKKRTK